MPIYLGSNQVNLASSSGSSSGGKHLALTQAEYDALSTEDKNNGTVYFITDGSASTVIVNDSVPIGAIQSYAGASAPSGWLICNGAAVSRSDYSELFAAIGTTYGAGNGSTTFNVPDLRGKVAIGVSTTHAIGTSGGEETHTLSLDEIPSHVGHLPVNSGSHTGYGNANGLYLAQGTMVTYGSDPRGWDNNGTEMVPAGVSRGGSQAHNNMQPFLTVNAIIKAKDPYISQSNVSQLLEMLYPVGSIYISTNSTSPATLFGGTWNQIKGRFLIGTGTPDDNTNTYWGTDLTYDATNKFNEAAGSTGGESRHTLAIYEMPEHNHSRIVYNGNGEWTLADNYGMGGTQTDAHSAIIQYSGTIAYANDTPASHFRTNEAGGSMSHNNMPPYFAVYMWERTA